MIGCKPGPGVSTCRLTPAAFGERLPLPRLQLIVGRVTRQNQGQPTSSSISRPRPTPEAYNHLSPGAAEAKGDLTSRAASNSPLSPGG
jgi:hypothetical protein